MATNFSQEALSRFGPENAFQAKNAGKDALQTPMARKGLQACTPSHHNSLKGLSNISSRKAFGNVSNVAASATKALKKNESDVVKSALPFDQLKKEAKVDLHEVLKNPTPAIQEEEEVEHMDIYTPVDELHDGFTQDLFAIDEEVAFNMQFDEDMSEFLVPRQYFDINEILNCL